MIKLDELSDEKLIKRIKTQFCSKSIEILINRHENIFHKAVHQYHKSHPETNLQDLLDDLYIVFNRAVDTFKFDKKTKFTTWAYYHTRWNCLNSNKNYGKTYLMEHKDIDAANESQNKWTNFSHNVGEMNKHIFHILSEMDDQRAKKIFYLRFIEGGERNKLKPWKDVAKKMKLSVMGVINVYTKSLKFLRYKLQDKEYSKP
jgi:RNA polymerase sigma factor (sigma-70 family)